MFVVEATCPHEIIFTDGKLGVRIVFRVSYFVFVQLVSDFMNCVFWRFGRCSNKLRGNLGSDESIIFSM